MSHPGNPRAGGNKRPRKFHRVVDHKVGRQADAIEILHHRLHPSAENGGGGHPGLGVEQGADAGISQGVGLHVGQRRTGGMAPEAERLNSRCQLASGDEAHVTALGLQLVRQRNHRIEVTVPGNARKEDLHERKPTPVATGAPALLR